MFYFINPSYIIHTVTRRCHDVRKSTIRVISCPLPNIRRDFAWWAFNEISINYAARSLGLCFNHFLPPRFINTISKGLAICRREERECGGCRCPRAGTDSSSCSALQLSCVFRARAGLGAPGAPGIGDTRGFASCMEAVAAPEGEGWKGQGCVWVRNRMG